jgi:hypothetical protein
MESAIEVLVWWVVHVLGWKGLDADRAYFPSRPNATKLRNVEAWKLRFHAIHRYLSTALAIAVGVIALCGFRYESHVAALAWTTTFGFFFLLLVWGAIEVNAFQLRISAEGLRLRRFPRRTVRFSWEDIKSIRSPKDPSDWHLHISLTDGRTLRLPEWINGLGTLRVFLERHVPEDRWRGVEGLLPKLPGGGVEGDTAC